MTAGNVLGGGLADRHPTRGQVAGFGSALVALALLAMGGQNAGVLMAGLFAVGATMMVAIPTIQVRLTKAAPDAPTLMGAMNLAALNVANAIGAWTGGQAIAQGHGLLSAVWAGFALTLAGLVLFLQISRVVGAITARGRNGEITSSRELRQQRTSGFDPKAPFTVPETGHWGSA